MLIIKPSRNKKNFYQIYFDDKLIGCVPKSLVPAEYFIENEIILSDEYIQSIQQWVEKDASNKLLEYLSKMERTVYDCKIYLKRHDVPDEIISKVIEEAVDKNWLSDKRYAEYYIEDSIRNNKSPLEIKYKLIQKKVNREIIDELLENVYDKDIQNNVLDSLIDNLISKYKKSNSGNLFNKIATALYRKGYHYHDYEDILRKKLKLVLNNLNKKMDNRQN